jgi:hypothetical protein
MGVSNLDGSNGQSGDKTAHQPSVDSTRDALSVPASGSHWIHFPSAGRMPCNWVVR